MFLLDCLVVDVILDKVFLDVDVLGLSARYTCMVNFYGTHVVLIDHGRRSLDHFKVGKQPFEVDCFLSGFAHGDGFGFGSRECDD